LAGKANITDRSSVAATVSIAHERFGPIDVLVNNAGGVHHLCPRSEDYFDDEEARRWEIDLNINGVTNCIQAVASDMLDRGQGSIINIGSGSSTSGRGAANVVHYGALKGYMNSLTIGLAFEWAPRGVRINNILPGWIVPYKEEHVGEGSFWNRFGFEQQGRPDDFQRALEEGTLFNVGIVPMGRLGRPEDIARLALFLASDVSGYITGQNISVAGSGP
jgi:NAD(P)-dependent dehydrogenase (short-subunit alcohol dehydrogenase family)